MKRWIGVFLAAVLMTGCSGQQAAEPTKAAGENTQPNRRTVFAMDTVMELSVYGAEDALMQRAEEKILELESLLSVTDEHSEIYALELCERTQGTLDISIYPVLRSWGFTTGEYRVPSQEELQNLLTDVDYTKLELAEDTASLAPGMQIDLGSVAKGYTGDLVSHLLRDGGVTSALLNLGGNVQVIGGKPDGSDWRVAVQDPESDGYLGVLTLRDKAAITSGGYERYFTGDDGQVYWHIIDPSTGLPAHSGLISVTVVGERGVVCAATSLLLAAETTDGMTANLYLDGTCIRSIDLFAVEDAYSFDVAGPGGSNQPGRIRVERADCPNQACVHQGRLADSAAPIVCLPNKLVIRVESAARATEIDSITR